MKRTHGPERLDQRDVRCTLPLRAGQWSSRGGSKIGRYLIVTHQTGESRELLDEVLAISAADAEAEFTILVPATPLAMLYLVGVENRQPRAIARERAQRVRERLEAAGIRVPAVRLGKADPMAAISEALRYQPFDAVVICTLPRQLSHWLRMDLPAQVRRRWPDMRVIHVVAPSAPTESTAAPAGRDSA